MAEIVVDSPAASVTLVALRATCGTAVRVRFAVCVCAATFLIVKRAVNVCAFGTVPKTRASVSTPPLATGVEVPACTAVPGVTTK